jgi:Family of unknown function (DUF5681)
MFTDSPAPKQRGRPFPEGKSGNPKGRPIGSRNAATLIAEQLLDGEAEKIIRMVIKKAKQGDVTCLRLCLDRLVPPRRDRPVNFKIPLLNSAEDATKAMAAISASIASGELTPSEAAELSSLIANYVNAVEVAEVDKRLSALEAASHEQQNT